MRATAEHCDKVAAEVEAAAVAIEVDEQVRQKERRGAQLEQVVQRHLLDVQGRPGHRVLVSSRPARRQSAHLPAVDGLARAQPQENVGDKDLSLQVEVVVVVVV